MWGSTFADLAKKVEEQAANMEISFPSDAVSDAVSMFNLDSMQGGGGGSANANASGTDGNQQQQEKQQQLPPQHTTTSSMAATTRIAPQQKSQSKPPSPPKPAMTVPTASPSIPKISISTTKPQKTNMMKNNSNSNNNITTTTSNDFFTAAGMTASSSTSTSTTKTTTTSILTNPVTVGQQPSKVMTQLLHKSSALPPPQQQLPNNNNIIKFEEESLDDSLLETPQPKPKLMAVDVTTTTTTTTTKEPQLPKAKDVQPFSVLPPLPVTATMDDNRKDEHAVQDPKVDEGEKNHNVMETNASGKEEEETWDFEDEDEDDGDDNGMEPVMDSIQKEEEPFKSKPVAATTTTANTNNSENVTANNKDDIIRTTNNNHNNDNEMEEEVITLSHDEVGDEWDFDQDETTTTGTQEDKDDDSKDNLLIFAAAETPSMESPTPVMNESIITPMTTTADSMESPLNDEEEETPTRLAMDEPVGTTETMIPDTSLPSTTTQEQKEDEWDFDDMEPQQQQQQEPDKEETITSTPVENVQELESSTTTTPLESNEQNLFNFEEFPKQQSQETSFVTEENEIINKKNVDKDDPIVVVETESSNGVLSHGDGDDYLIHKEQTDDTGVVPTPPEEEEVQEQSQQEQIMEKEDDIEESFSMNDLDVMYDDESESSDDGTPTNGDNTDFQSEEQQLPPESHDDVVTTPEPDVFGDNELVTTPEPDVFGDTELAATASNNEKEEKIMFDILPSEPLQIDTDGYGGDGIHHEDTMLSPIISPIGAVPEDVNSSQYLNQAVSDTVAASEKLNSFLYDDDDGDKINDGSVEQKNVCTAEDTPTSIDSELLHLAESEEQLRQELAREEETIINSPAAASDEPPSVDNDGDNHDNIWATTTATDIIVTKTQDEFLMEEEESEKEQVQQFVSDDPVVAVNTPLINPATTEDAGASEEDLLNLSSHLPLPTEEDDGGEVVEVEPIPLEQEEDRRVYYVQENNIERENEASDKDVTQKVEEQHPQGVIDDSFAAELENMQEDTLPLETADTEVDSNAMFQEESDSAAVAAALTDTGTANEDQPPTSTQESSADASGSAASDQMMEQFTMQMQRLEQYYQEEMKQMEQRHKNELENSGGDHEQCVATMKDIESEFRQQLDDKDTELRNAAQEKEGLSLKIDVLKRELEGTQKILEDRNNDMSKTRKTYDLDVERLKSQYEAMEETASTRGGEVQKLQEALDESKKEVELSNESYATLKGRVKVVATELKERRIECRTLHSEVTVLKTSNESMVTQIDNLQTQLVEQASSREESGDNMNKMRTKMEALEGELAVAQKAVNERGAVGDKAISAYKKKAQNALGAANARAAAANLAKEEAELEASASKTAAKEALERARMAETNLKEAVAEADNKAKKFEDQNHQLVKDLSDTKSMLKKSDVEYQQMATELDTSRTSREKLIAEVNNLSNGIEEEKSKSIDLKQELIQMKRDYDGLREEAETLREEVQRSAAAAFMEGHESKKNGNADGMANVNQNGGNSSESEATILMLQQELKGANQAIKELKEALKGAIDNQTSKVEFPQPIASWESHDTEEDAFAYVASGINSTAHDESYKTATSTSAKENPGGGNDSTPLFYAIEKQAELNTARNEIARLANLLGDAEASKMDALDAMDDMKKKMEQADARLRRYEKMGPGADRRLEQESSMASATGNLSTFGSAPRMFGGRPPVGDDVPNNKGSTNLEYLKNVMLSYLNAKTLTERKALVPVLSAVLELTSEETANAMSSVEASGSLEGVGTSFLENFSNKVQSGNLDLSSFLA